MLIPTTVIDPPTHTGQKLKLGAMLLGLGIAGFTLFHGYLNGNMMRAFFQVMAGLFILGMATVVYGFRVIGRETVHQEQFLRGLRQEDLWSYVEDYEEDSLSWRVLESLRKAQFVSPASESAEFFLDGMERRLAKPARDINWYANIAVSLGLLGTAFGMTLMLTDFQDLAAAGELIAGDGGGQLFRQLFGEGGPLSQLGFAFGSTVLGLIVKLILSSLAHVLERNAEHVTGYLADACAANIGPGIRRAG